jgi:hypothetical protein
MSRRSTGPPSPLVPADLLRLVLRALHDEDENFDEIDFTAMLMAENGHFRSIAEVAAERVLPVLIEDRPTQVPVVQNRVATQAEQAPSRPRSQRARRSSA